MAQDGRTWDFQNDPVNTTPSGFSFAKTGHGRPGKWVVRIDADQPTDRHVLAQVDRDETGDRFPVAVADSPIFKDVRVEVRCKPVSGNVDEACGLVLRYLDENNYYVARANALEDNVRLYHVVKGRRRQFAGWDGKVVAHIWHTLAVEARRDELQVFWNGERVIHAKDDTFKDAGKVGLWTRADSVSYFDTLSVNPL